MAFCPNCGNQMSDNAKFCMDCGVKLDNSSCGLSIEGNDIQRSQIGTASGGNEFNEENSEEARIKRKYFKLMIIGIIFKLPLIFFAIKQIYAPIQYEIGVLLLFIIFSGILVSNKASSWIVAYIKDYYLWKKVNEDYNKNIKLDWKKKKNYSSISQYLGMIERIIVVIAGLSSLQMFLAAAGAWTTIKIATDWTNFIESDYRAISHIYLISTSMSLLLALIDVVAIRALIGMDFII